MKYKLTITVDGDDAAVHVEGVVTQEHEALFREYLTYAEELWRTAWVQRGCPLSLNISFDQQSPTEFTHQLPERAEVAEFLHALRPLILERERTHFNKVCGAVAQAVPHDRVRSMLRAYRAYFSGQHMRGTIRVRTNELEINTESTLKKWLNGYEYHRDLDKRRELEDAHQLMPLDASTVFFLSMLTEKVHAVIQLSSLLQVLLGSRKGMTTQALRRRPGAEEHQEGQVS